MLCEPIAFTDEDFRRLVQASPAQMRDMTLFLRRLGEANQVMNLVGPSAVAEFWRRHAYDSAQLLHVEQSALRWADVGAGAGFPGLILAILLKGRAGAEVHLIESMAKRARFLRDLVQELGLPATVHHARAEELATPIGLEIVTARACAPLPKLFQYTEHFFRHGARGLFLKGRGVEAELIEARRTWTLGSELIDSRSDPLGRIVRIDSLSRRGG